MATTDELKAQKEAFAELKLASRNLQRATDGLGTVAMDNSSFVKALGKDLGKLNKLGKRFNIFQNLQIAQFAKQRLLNKFSFGRDKKARKILMQQQNLSKEEAKQLLRKAKIFKAEEAKIAAEKKILEQWNITADFMKDQEEKIKSWGKVQTGTGTEQGGIKNTEKNRKKEVKEKKQVKAAEKTAKNTGLIYQFDQIVAKRNEKRQGIFMTVLRAILAMNILKGILRFGKSLIPGGGVVAGGGKGKLGLLMKVLTGLGLGYLLNDYLKEKGETSGTGMAAGAVTTGMVAKKLTNKTPKIPKPSLRMPPGIGGNGFPRAGQFATKAQIKGAKAAAKAAIVAAKAAKAAEKITTAAKAGTKAVTGGGALAKYSASVLNWVKTSSKAVTGGITGATAAAATVGTSVTGALAAVTPPWLKSALTSPKAKKILGGAARGVGKVAAILGGPIGWAMLAGFAANDAIDAWNNAGKLFGKEPGELKLSEKVVAAVGGAIDGLTFGLVSAQSIVNKYKAIGNIFSQLKKEREFRRGASLVVTAAQANVKGEGEEAIKAVKADKTLTKQQKIIKEIEIKAQVKLHRQQLQHMKKFMQIRRMGAKTFLGQKSTKEMIKKYGEKSPEVRAKYENFMKELVFNPYSGVLQPRERKALGLPASKRDRAGKLQISGAQLLRYNEFMHGVVHMQVDSKNTADAVRLLADKATVKKSLYVSDVILHKKLDGYFGPQDTLGQLAKMMDETSKMERQFMRGANGMAVVSAPNTTMTPTTNTFTSIQMRNEGYARTGTYGR